MPHDVTFTTKASWPVDSDQTDYELGNLGMDEARALFEGMEVSGVPVHLSRVWATIDHGTVPTDPEAKAFLVNVVLRIEDDADVAQTLQPSDEDADLFDRVVHITLDETCAIDRTWVNRGYVEAPRYGPGPTLRFGG